MCCYYLQLKRYGFLLQNGSPSWHTTYKTLFIQYSFSKTRQTEVIKRLNLNQ